MNVAVVGWCLLGLVLLVVILLGLPVYHVTVYQTGKPVISYLRILFAVKIDLTQLGGQEQAAQTEQGKRKARRKKEKPKAQKEPEEFSEQLGMIVDLLQSIKKGAGLLLRSFQIRLVRLHMIVACEDAAQTAIAYGKVNAAVYSTWALAKSLWKMKQPDIAIRPDFTSEKGMVDFQVRARLIPIVAVIAAVRIGCIFLVKTIGRKRNERQQEKRLEEKSTFSR